MNTLRCFLLALTLVAPIAFSQAVRTVVSVDTNNVANISSLRIDSVSADSVRTGNVILNENLYESKDGLVYLPVDNRTITLAWPTNYVYSYTNYPGGNRDYVDPFVTEWFLNKAIGDVRADLSVFGDTNFIARYIDNPPTNMQSLVNYVSNCVYLLSNVEVQMSYNTVSNDIEELKTRVSRTEVTADHFGAGVSDLDNIINSDIEDMDAENMLEMIKTLALYIKNGTTNVVLTTGESDE